MQGSHHWRIAVACAGLVAAATLGCSNLVDGKAGKPQDGSDCVVDCTEPTGETSTPTFTSTVTAAPPPPPAIPSAPPAPPPAETLPSENGYTFIETKTGLTRCQISAEEVGCEAAFTSSPTVDGSPANGVRVSAAGDMEWVLGNLGAIPTVPLDYQTYRAQGWTIAATSDGTRFTNDATGHGAFVSVQRVEAF